MQKKNLLILLIILLFGIFSCSKKSDNPEDEKISENAESIEILEKENELYSLVNKLRVRNEPGLDGKAIAHLSEGEMVVFLEESELKAEVVLREKKYNSTFYKIKRYDGSIGWVYGAALYNSKIKNSGTGSIVKVPKVDQLFKEGHNVFLLYNPNNQFLALLANEGHRGASDYHDFFLDIFNCKNSKRVEHFSLKMTDEMIFDHNYPIQKIFEYFWVKHDKKIQTIFKKYGFKELFRKDSIFKKESADMIGLTLNMEKIEYYDEKFNDIKSVFYKGKPVWDVKNLDYLNDIVSFVSVVSISDDYYRVTLSNEVLGGEGSEDIAFYVSRREAKE